MTINYLASYNQHLEKKLASVGILGKEREPGVGKLGWHGDIDTGFERNTY